MVTNFTYFYLLLTGSMIIFKINFGISYFKCNNYYRIDVVYFFIYL